MGSSRQRWNESRKASMTSRVSSRIRRNLKTWRWLCVELKLNKSWVRWGTRKKKKKLKSCRWLMNSQIKWWVQQNRRFLNWASRKAILYGGSHKRSKISRVAWKNKWIVFRHIWQSISSRGHFWRIVTFKMCKSRINWSSIQKLIEIILEEQKDGLSNLGRV